jgi:hypothetical protein
MLSLSLYTVQPSSPMILSLTIVWLGGAAEVGAIVVEQVSVFDSDGTRMETLSFGGTKACLILDILAARISQKEGKVDNSPVGTLSKTVVQPEPEAG